jgi:hypothetical protein
MSYGPSTGRQGRVRGSGPEALEIGEQVNDSFFQVVIDQSFGVAVPNGHGHDCAETMVSAWAAMAEPAAWNEEKAERLRAIIATYPNHRRRTRVVRRWSQFPSSGSECGQPQQGDHRRDRDGGCAEIVDGCGGSCGECPQGPGQVGG